MVPQYNEGKKNFYLFRYVLVRKLKDLNSNFAVFLEILGAYCVLLLSNFCVFFLALYLLF